jgi:hypothetical protein
MSSADVRAYYPECMQLLQEGSVVVATSDGKVDGPSFGGKIHTGTPGVEESDSTCEKKLIMKITDPLTLLTDHFEKTDASY